MESNFLLYIKLAFVELGRILLCFFLSSLTLVLQSYFSTSTMLTEVFFFFFLFSFFFSLLKFDRLKKLHFRLTATQCNIIYSSVSFFFSFRVWFYFPLCLQPIGRPSEAAGCVITWQVSCHATRRKWEWDGDSKACVTRRYVWFSAGFVLAMLFHWSRVLCCIPGLGTHALVCVAQRDTVLWDSNPTTLRLSDTK